MGGALNSLAPAPEPRAQFQPSGQPGGGFQPIPNVVGGQFQPVVTMGGQGFQPSQATFAGFDPAGLAGLPGFAPSPGGNTPFQPWGMNPLVDPNATRQGATPGQNPLTGSQGGVSGGTPGKVGDGTDQWRGIIDEESAPYNNAELADMVQAIMMLESGGKVDAVSPAGAQGLMQVMPFHFGSGENPFDPRTNIRKGIQVLMNGYNRWKTWEQAAAAYLGAIDANGNIVGGDINVTGKQYVAIVMENLAKVKAAKQAAPKGGGTGFSSIWGGQGNPKITQEIGVVSPNIDQRIYQYGREFGFAGGHTGLDIGLARGSQLYLPQGFSGVVVERAPGYFKDEDYGDDGYSYDRGELRIRLDNGWELILGHNSKNLVMPGTRVSGGDLVALSGSAGGDHLHLELRIPDPSTPSGWRIVDPRQYLG